MNAEADTFGFYVTFKTALWGLAIIGAGAIGYVFSNTETNEADINRMKVLNERLATVQERQERQLENLATILDAQREVSRDLSSFMQQHHLQHQSTLNGNPEQ